jgi:hypothetical protein
MTQANDYNHNSSRSTANYPKHSGPAPNNGGQIAPHHQPGQTIIQVCGDVKPRLTKEQHDILERHFQQQSKPTTSTKKGFADALGVPLDKINVILICSFLYIPATNRRAELVPKSTSKGQAGSEKTIERVCHVSSNDSTAFATVSPASSTTTVVGTSGVL